MLASSSIPTLDSSGESRVSRNDQNLQPTEGQMVSPKSGLQPTSPTSWLSRESNESTELRHT